MDEVPRAQVPLLPFDDQNRFAGDDEEVLLIGLQVVYGHRFARHEHEWIDAELFGLPLAFEIVERDADGAAALGVTPHGLAHAEDEPSVVLRDEPVLGLLQLRLGNHRCRNVLSRAVLELSVVLGLVVVALRLGDEVVVAEGPLLEA